VFNNSFREVAAGNESILVVVNLDWNDQMVNANQDGDLPTIATYYTGSLNTVYAEK